MFLRRFLWVPALLAGGGVLLSQPQDDVLRVTTRLVQIDVVVTDESGPVADLGPEDFTILDEGVPRPIAVFNLTRSRRSVEPAVELPLGAVSNRFDRDGRTPDTATVLLVDRLNTLGPDQPFADAQARAFLEDAPDEAWVAVYELTSGGLTVLGDYTSRPDEIRIALNDRKPQHSTPLQYSVCSLDDFQPDADLMPFYSGPTIDDAPRRIDAEPPPDPPDFCLSGPPDPFLRTAARYYVELRADQTAAALEAIARRLADLPGRKNLVWLASSFPFTFDPHQHHRFYNAVTFATLERIEAVARLLSDANVAIYPIDARGLADDPLKPKEIAIMTKLADMTGGRVTFNTNGLSEIMTRAVRDTEVTYTLGFYVPEDETDTGFHEIEVSVDRPGVDVRHRRGYYGFGEEPPLRVQPSLEEALMSAFDATGLGLLARAAPVDDNPGTYDLAVIADVENMGLAIEDDQWVGSLTVLLYYHPLGEEDGLLFEPEVYPVRLTGAQLETARQTGFFLRRQIETGGRAGHLRVLVRDTGTGATGSVWVPVGVE